MESGLPLEVLSHILSFLDPLQRVSAGLVCRRWLDASSSLLEDVCLTFRGQPSLPLTGRTFPRVTLISTYIDDHCIDFLDTLGPTLLHLRFISCCVRTERKAAAYLRLETLETNCGYALLVFSTLPRLRDLNLKHASDLHDDTLMEFDKIAAPHLELFAMPDKTVYEIPKLNRFYPEGITLESEPSSCIVSRAALEVFVARRAATLTTLHLPPTITPDAALFLSRLPGLKLRRVSFAYCIEDIAPITPEFCRHQPGIVGLIVDNTKTLSSEDVSEICELLPDLCEFSCSQCFLFFDWGVVPLFRLRRLRSLQLAWCVCVTPSSFSSALPTTPMQHLRTLDLSHTKIADDQIRALLPQIPLLEELDMSKCDVSDAALVFLPRLLRVLVLRGCIQVKDEGLRWIRSLTRLHRLDLCGCRGLTSAGVIESVRFRHLRDLNLFECPKVSSRVLAPLRAHNRCLVELRVS